MAQPDVLDFESGRRFGRYTIVKRISVGGMAEVFLALARGPGEFKKFVTVKRILPEYRADAEFVTMFLEEARISAALSHANIAQVFDLGTEAGELFLTMEFVPGEDIHNIMRIQVAREGHAPPFGFTAMVLRDALHALHHAHTFVDAAGTRSPVVHRDVSPRNVMVTYGGTVKVIDFGIAKAMRDPAADGAGSTRGSRGYMSPEQIRGDTVDARTDVFAIGVLLHEMLVGKRLFLKKGDPRGAEVDLKAVPRPHVVDASIPEALSNVAMQALASEPSARWQTARDMARAIEHAIGADIWEEDRAAGYMESLFSENLARTRAVLHLAAHSRGTVEMTAVLEDPPIEDGGSTQVTAVVGPPRPRHKTGSPRRRPVIVAVDDSNAALQLLKYHMNSFSIDVVTCSAPGDAIEAIGSATPDAVILDVIMPDIDGFELCKKIRSLKSAQRVPILFLSAACDLDERTRCLDVGGDDFIKKPYVPEELAARLRSHFGRAALIDHSE